VSHVKTFQLWTKEVNFAMKYMRCERIVPKRRSLHIWCGLEPKRRSMNIWYGLKSKKDWHCIYMIRTRTKKMVTEYMIRTRTKKTVNEYMIWTRTKKTVTEYTRRTRTKKMTDSGASFTTLFGFRVFTWWSFFCSSVYAWPSLTTLVVKCTCHPSNWTRFLL
jgi:hypothetical protein